MKKNLRLLCLGLAAATITCGFAQEDKTSLLKNTDMEQGLKGWSFDGGKLMGKNTKNPASRTGFYGMNEGVLEAWNGNGNGLADSYIMQRVGGDLPNGTYVFGAYIGASKQGTQWENRDSVFGVTLFANDSKVPVATENPDMNYKYAWGHSAKFNVAVTLTGAEARPGYLDLGLRYENTNANYVVWDNVTLYYFGEKTEAEALDAMAKIDMENIVAIADTFVQKEIVMNADTLKDLKDAIKVAKEGKTTAATLWEDSEALFWQIGLARKSQSDYASLKKSLDFAKVVSEGTWSKEYKDFYYDNLMYAIEDAQYAYEDLDADRARLTELRTELDKCAGFLRLDSVAIALEALNTFIREGAFTNLPGEYTTDQQKGLQALAKELNDTMGVVESPSAVNPRPQDLYPYIARVYAAIEEVKNNPYDGAWLMTLPQSSTDISGRKPLAGTELDTLNRYSYTSPLIEFKEPVELLRLTVSKVTSASQIYFCISSLEFFDATGAEIELTAENFYSNADHNSFGGADGQSYQGLVDDDPSTYFHSKWSDDGKINGELVPHYLEVTLPNGGYTAVSFKMVSRDEKQNHQFPAEIVLTTPVVKRGLTAVETALNDAKALNAYYGTDPGFYTKEFSALAAAMAQAEALLENYTSEEDCNNVVKALRAEITNFNNDDSKAYGLPDPEKTYRIVSAFPGYYEKQGVEKALTIHAADTTLWWENVCLDSLQQEFQFVPILNEDGEPYFELKEEGKDENDEPIMVPYYCYNLKNVKTGLYADSTFANSKIHLVEEATDTIRLKWLGRGQWNIMAKNGTFHTGDHNSGNVGGANGAYGGTWGVSSAIVPYGGGLDGASAWYIREMHAMPYEVAVAAGQFKSEYIYFEPSNTVTLTADKACAFEDLTLYDLFGSVIAVDTLEVLGNAAIVSLTENVVTCAFAFNNAEGVTSVAVSATVPQIQLLQKAYDAAVAVAPVEGTEVAQYADLSAYNAALAAAEELLANGGSDEDMVKAIDALDAAVKALEPNMPEAGKVYCIYNAVDFEANFGYKMVLAAQGSSNIRWKNENALDLQQYWQFEPASVEQLKEAGMDTTTCAFYIKNLATKKYIGELNVTDGVTTALEDTIASAMPFAINILGVGTEVSLDGNGSSGKRLHANSHGGGKGTGANIVYWGSGAGTASAWNIVDASETYKIADLIDMSGNSVEFVEVESTVKGIYDLFGRRVVAPTAPGIYIIDGKKKYVK